MESMAETYLTRAEEGRREMWQAYYASVTFMDEQLGKSARRTG